MAQITSSRSRARRRWLVFGAATCVGIGFVAFAFAWVAQSVAVPSIALIALSLPALWLVRPGLRRPNLFLLCALAYSLLAGALTTSANVNADVAVIGFSVVALILLVGAVVVWRVGATRDWSQVRALRAGWSDIELQRSAIGLAVVLWAIALAGALIAIGPGKVWGARSLGQLATLIGHPGLGAWWGALVGADGLAGAACVAWFGRRLGLSWFACAIAAVLWATCPARVWPSAMHLAPTFLAPLAAAAALLALRDRSSALGIVVAIAFVVAAAISPVIAVVIGIEVVVAVALSRRTLGSAGAGATGAAIVVLVIALGDAGLRPVGVWSLFGAVEPMRALGADGALPWESLAPPTLLPQLFGIEQHAGSAFWLCVAPGWALIASAIVVSVLVPSAGRLPLRPWIGWTTGAGLYAALPSHIFGVGLPSLANLLAAFGSQFAGAAGFGLCVSVACALAAAPALDAIAARRLSIGRMLAAAVIAVLAVWAVLPAGPHSASLRSDGQIDAAIHAFDDTGRAHLAYYPLVDADSPRGLALRYVETITHRQYANFTLSARDHSMLADIADPRTAGGLRRLGVRFILFDEDAYARPLMQGALAPWAWLPRDLDSSPVPPPIPPPSLVPVAAYFGGHIVLYRL